MEPRALPGGQDRPHAGAEQEASAHAEYETISALLSRGFPFLRFPAPFEAQFARHLRRLGQGLLRTATVSILLFYGLVGLAAFYFLGLESFLRWLPAYLLQGGALLGLMALARKRPLERFYSWYTAAAAWATLVGVSVVTLLMPDAALRQYASYGILYLTLAIYGLSCLPLAAALPCCLLAGATVLLLAAQLALPLDLAQFSQYFLAANMIGMVFSYLLEYRERTLFLTNRLLALERAELARVTQRLGKQSQEDPLTGLANRRHFNEQFQLEWDRGRRTGQPLSLVFIDVDHFKKYNDHYGHIEGDGCLVAVSSVLAAQVRRAGDLAVRYGGEEFVLLLPNTPLDGALSVAQAVLASVDALQAPHAASSTAPHVTVSVGVASAKPNTHLEALALLECADGALYEAKEGGRHRAVSRVLEVPKPRLVELAG